MRRGGAGREVEIRALVPGGEQRAARTERDADLLAHLVEAVALTTRRKLAYDEYPRRQEEAGDDGPLGAARRPRSMPSASTASAPRSAAAGNA